MATFTSKAAGNWSSGGQTTWNEVGVPGVGDTVTITHAITVDVNTTVGASTAYNTVPAIYINNTTLTVASGVTFKVRGDVLHNVGKIVLQPGCTWMWDSSVSGVNYVGRLFNFYQNSGITAGDSTGVDTRRVTITSTGSANGYWKSINGIAAGGVVESTTFGFYLELYRTDFVSLGTSSEYSVMANTTNLSVQKVILYDVTFTNCGPPSLKGPNTATRFEMTSVIISGTLNATYALQIDAGTTIGTGTRIMTKCVFDKSVDGPGGAFANFTITYCYFGDGWRNVSGTSNKVTSMSNCFIRQTTDQLPICGTVSNCYALYDSPVLANPHWFNASLQNGPITFDGVIFDFNGTDPNGNMIVFTAGASVTALNVYRCIGLPNAAGKSGGALMALDGSGNVSATVEHNTHCCGGQFVLEMGHLVPTSVSGQYASYQSNLAYSTTTPSSTDSFHAVDLDHRNSGSGASTDLITTADYNGSWKLTAPSATMNATISTTPAGWYTNQQKGYAAKFSYVPGVHDVEANPNFIDSSRNVAKWAQVQYGADGTYAGALAVIKADVYTRLPLLLDYVRKGFAPQNTAFKNAGHDGTDIGAVSVALTSSRGNVAISVGVSLT